MRALYILYIYILTGTLALYPFFKKIYIPFIISVSLHNMLQTTLKSAKYILQIRGFSN